MENEKTEGVMIKTLRTDISLEFALYVIDFFTAVICRVINLFDGFLASPSENKSFKSTHDVLDNIFLVLSKH